MTAYNPPQGKRARLVRRTTRIENALIEERFSPELLDRLQVRMSQLNRRIQSMGRAAR